MENKEEMLDSLFVSGDEASEQEVKTEKAEVVVKEEDIKAITKDVNELSKQFDKKNKEELNKIKKAEDAKNAAKEEVENNAIAKERKSKVSALLGILAFPFVLMGGVLIWNYFIAEQSIDPLTILTILMSLSTFAIGVKTLIKGIMKKSAFKRKLGSIAFGLLMLGIAITIACLKEYIQNFAFIVFGTFSAIIGFIALFSMVFKKERKGFDIFKIVMSALVFAGSIMLILAGVVFGNVALYMQILGILLAVVGCVLFVL